MKKLLLVIILSLSCLLAFAQAAGVTGTVKDSDGNPVAGAVVMIENGRGGVVTDALGRYSISAPSPESVLIFNCLGFKEAKIPIAKRAIVNVVLENEAENLDEVVVVGYGAMRRSDLTGSVTSVRINEDEAAKSSSLDQMLEGRAAGVQVLADNSSPDAGITIRVRGIASFSGNTDPLYVVDGIIVNGASLSITTMSVGSSSNATESTNGLSGINPQDIASIEILKDASATAIYGSQGSNGVVLITTKSASRDIPVVRYNAGVTVSKATRKIRLLDFDEFVDYLDNYPDNTAANEYLSNIYTDPATRSGLKVTPMDWQDFVMRTGISQRHYLSVFGRPKDTNYFFSIGYYHSEGVLKRTMSDNISGRLNLEKRYGKNIKLTFKTSFGYTKSDMVTGAVSGGNVTSRSSLIRTTMRSKPFMFKSPDAAEEDESQTDSDSELNYGPSRWLKGSSNTSERIRIIPSASFEWRFLPWLTFRSTAGGEVGVQERVKTKAEKISVGNGNLAGIGEDRTVLYNIDNLLIASKKLKKHSVSMTLGQSASRNRYSVESISGWNLPQTSAREKDINNALPQYSQLDSWYRSQSSLMSFFGRGIYNYGDRYVLTATLRFDGSSKFQGSNKWGVFPSLAFAWRIASEPWFKVPVISNAKLRLGWGQVGNQAISNYQTRRTYATSTLGSHFDDSYKDVVLSPSNLANPYLKWETSNQLNAGLDLSLWKGRFTLTMDAYRKDTWDLLQSKNVALSTGVGSMYVNDGSIRNQGLEISIDTVPYKKGTLEWTLGGNISLNRNKIVSVGAGGDSGLLYLDDHSDPVRVNYFYGNTLQTSGDTNPLNIFIEGQPMGLFYGYLTDGIVQTGESGIGFSEGDSQEPGSIKYKDLNGNGYIDVGDRSIIGNPLPKFTYGFNTSLSFKGLTLTLTFSGAYGFDIFNMNNIQDYATNYTKNVRREAVVNAWSETNPSNKWPKIGIVDNHFSDRFVEDGSYLRLSDLSLSYAVPLKKEKVKFLKALNVSASIGNPLVLTRYSGYSPFANSFGANVKRMGVDLNSAPYPLSYNFDLKFTF